MAYPLTTSGGIDASGVRLPQRVVREIEALATSTDLSIRQIQSKNRRSREPGNCRRDHQPCPRHIRLLKPPDRTCPPTQPQATFTGAKSGRTYVAATNATGPHTSTPMKQLHWYRNGGHRFACSFVIRGGTLAPRAAGGYLNLPDPHVSRARRPRLDLGFARLAAARRRRCGSGFPLPALSHHTSSRLPPAGYSYAAVLPGLMRGLRGINRAVLDQRTRDQIMGWRPRIK
jgi:hypothetical protein